MTKARHLQILHDLAELRQRIWTPALADLPEQIDKAEHDLKTAWSAERARLAKRSTDTADAIAAFCRSV